MAEKINGYTVEFIHEYRDMMVEDAIQNALGAEKAGMPETAEFWDILVDEYRNAGSYNVQFTINNLQLSSGIYFYQLKAGEFVETKKMPILKKLNWYLDLTKRPAEKPLASWMLKALKFNRKKFD